MMYCTQSPFNTGVLNFNPEAIKTAPKSNRYFIDNITDTVCKYYGLDLYELKCKSHKRTYSDARSIAIYLIAKQAPRMTLTEIGLLFSKRHHSTVIHAKKKFKALHDTDAKFRADYQRIIKRLNRQFKKDEATLITDTIND